MSQIISIDDPLLMDVVKPAFERGNLVVFPTETVYGVACQYTNADSIQRIYAAKNRPATKALQIMLADISYTERVATGFPPAAAKLAAAFMPGALTITLPKRPDIPAVISQYPTVGIRIPDYPPLQAIIRELGGVIAITSANRSGEASPTTMEMAHTALGDAVAVYVDGGRVIGGQSSTVVETTLGDEVTILRQGPITQAQIDAVLAAE